MPAMTGTGPLFGVECVIFTLTDERNKTMAFNNTVTLIGNLGSEARILEKDGRRFAAFSIATVDSFQDSSGDWQSKPTVWHDLVSFSPQVIQQVKSLKKGTRIQVTGSLSYRAFPSATDSGGSIQKKEATVIARKLELKTLVKKMA